MKEKHTGDGQGLYPVERFATLLNRVQVNVPYQQLVDKYLELFIHYRINPEIGFDATTLEKLNLEAVEGVARLLAEHGRTITFHGPFMDLATGGIDEQVRELSAKRLRQTMDLVPLFRPRSIVFHAGYDDRRYHAHREEWLENSLATWEPLVRRAEQMGVEIHLENVYEQTPEMILALLEAISSKSVGFCLDAGHMNTFGEVSLLAWLEALRPFLREVHLHDNDGQRDTHGPIGSGSFPFELLFQYLRDNGMNPLLTLEPHEDASLWRSLEKLEGLWPWED